MEEQYPTEPTLHWYFTPSNIFTVRLQAEVQEASEDLEAACRHSFAHGTLLALRYMVPEVPWPSTASGSNAADADAGPGAVRPSAAGAAPDAGTQRGAAAGYVSCSGGGSDDGGGGLSTSAASAAGVGSRGGGRRHGGADAAVYEEWLRRLLGLLMQATNLVLGPLSDPQGQLIGEFQCANVVLAF